MAIPGNANLLLLQSAAAAPTEYAIERSLRFNSADSAYLNRTPSTAGNRKTWTWAGWVKRSALGSFQYLFDANGGSTREAPIRFYDTDVFSVASVVDPGGVQYELVTTAVFRDLSAWYHFVVAFDTTQATASNRIKIYVNGVQITSFSTSTYPSQNTDYSINSNIAHYIGRYTYTPGRYFNGYLADVHFIDGQALDPTSFGEFDADTGIWNPIEYTGSYGTNGFHLPFSDNSSAAALGYDAAGSNDWTVNNISVASGAGNDSLVDVPTNGTETDTGAGGEVRGNYCTWNPLDLQSTTLANGNLQASGSTAVAGVSGTIGVNSGKWYWEITAGSTQDVIGIWPTDSNVTGYPGLTSDSFSYYGFGGSKITGNVSTAYGASFTSGDVIGVALDLDAGTLSFYKNNVSQGTAFSGLTGGFRPAIRAGSPSGASTATYLNAGQRPFAYTAPSGYKALCTANLPAPTVEDGSDYMDVVTYTGTGTSQTISGLEFSPDFVWFKSRSNAYSHQLYDIIRGANQALVSNTTAAEATYTNGLSAFNSDGFTANGDAGTNGNTATYVAWAWDAGSSTVSNTDGSITSSVRANPTAGFSIVTYTGAGSAGTVGHGLNTAPTFMVFKQRTGGNSWAVYHTSIGTGSYLTLESTQAALSNVSPWNNTAPTSTVFSLATASGSDAVNRVNLSGENYVAYCFAPVEGYSAFGSYLGNGSSDGPMVFTGMRPRWILFKKSSGTENWRLHDTARSTYNAAQSLLFPNLSNAETTSSEYAVDVLSNGFKIRTNVGGSLNDSGATYVYACFAENPFALNARAR